jgi:tetratricopeptide (TPR) repeat protein
MMPNSDRNFQKYPVPLQSARALRHLFAAMAFTFLAGSHSEAADTADEARSINQQVLALIAASNLADAAVLAKKGLALCDDTGVVKAFCASQFNELLGDIAHRQQRYPDALSYHRRALAIREEALGHNHMLVARSQFRIGRAALARHDNSDAETAFKDAIAIFDKLAPRDQERAAALLQLQTTYMAAERFAEAVPMARQALEAYTALEGPTGTRVGVSRRTLGAALISLGRRQTDQQNLVDAEKSLHEGVQLFDPPLPGWERVFATSLALLGKIYETRGLNADAEAYDFRALDYYSKFASPTDPLLLQILSALADRYDRMDRPETSAQYAQRIISTLDENKQETAALGSALIWLRRFDEAISSFKAALAILKAKSGDKALIVGYALAGAANAYAGKGDQATSARLLASAIEILGPTIGKQPRPRWL